MSYTTTWKTYFLADAEACRLSVAAWEGAKGFEFKGTEGFMVTIDISSRDAI